MSPTGYRWSGIALLVVSAILVLIALRIGWSSVQRWRAVNAISAHHLARLADRPDVARDHAARAARLLPDDAATALPAIDPSTPEAAEALQRLRRRAPVQQRAIIGSALTFVGVLRGGGDDDPAPGDAPFLKHLRALARGELPPFPQPVAGDPPQAAISAYAAQRHIAAAWAAGDREALRTGLAVLVLHDPRHPQYKTMRALLAAMTPGTDERLAEQLIGQAGADAVRIARRTATLVPERAAAMAAVIPAAQRTPEEIQRLIAAGGAGATLEQLVQQALAQPSPTTLAVVQRRCLDEDRIDLAQRLAQGAPQTMRRDLDIALAAHSGDAQALAALMPDRPDLRLRITPPIGRPGLITFHLGTAAGLVPRVGVLSAKVGGHVVPATNIRRWGSLVLLVIPQTGGTPDLEVRVGDTAVFSGQVQL